MSLRPGVTVLGRYRLVQELRGTADLWRWEAEDLATSQRVEIVAPTLMAALRPEAAERFEAADAVDGDAVQRRLAEGVEGRLPVAVRPLGRGPWPEDMRLSPEQALGVASWLGRGVLDGELVLPDGLRAEDLVIDAEGVPRLAPTALVHSGAVNQPPRHRPPELTAGRPPTPESALYGLGALLTRATLGVHAVPGDTAAAWVSSRARPARSLRPDLPEGCARLLDDLLSPDPQVRRAAILALPPAEPPQLAVAAPEAARSVAAPAVSPVAPAVAPRGVVAVDRGLGPWVVAVRPSALGEGARRRVAAVAGTTASALQQAGAGERWVPVGSATSEREAAEQAARLVELGASSRVFPGEPPTGRLIGAMALILLAALSGLVGLFVWPLLVVALAGGIGGAALAVGAWRLRSLQQGANAASRQIEQAKASQAQTIEVLISAARATVLDADLPEPARLDLLGTLDNLEEQAPAPDDARRALEQVRAAVEGMRGDVARTARLDQPLAAIRAARREVEGSGEPR